MIFFARLCLAFVLILCAATLSWSQTDKPKAPPEEMSLADRARAARKAKNPDGATETASKSKRVLTNDNLEVKRGSFADINLDQDNSEDLLDSMQLFRRMHTLKETEKEISEWWAGQSATLDVLKQRSKQSNNYDQYGSYPTDVKDYKKYQQDMRLKQLQNRDNYKSAEEISAQVRSMESTMGRVAYGLRGMGISGAWLDDKRRR